MNESERRLDMIANSLEQYAKMSNKATLKFRAPNQGHLIYVSPRESDVLFGLMSCVIDIMIQRGKLEGDERVKIRRLTDVIAPGHEVWWSVIGPNGVEIGGYASSEAEATRKIANFMLTGQRPNS